MEPLPPPPTPPPPPPPPPVDVPSPTGSQAARFKPVWRLLLISNLVLGAYIFSRAGKRDKIKTANREVEESKAEKEVSASPPINMDTYAEESLLQYLAMKPVKIHRPVPEEEKRELFKWILEEKRKVKPQNREEKKQIDEEKAILKQFIRAESIPNL
ncbi:hypothetical protein BT93_C2163 [Corymbia citriodora subsp. variegata]|nr:hypothetical protein BT93_C2163 [Corymbia citriodora subsp. variegata]